MPKKTNKKARPEPPSNAKDAMRPEVRKAFEASYRRNEEAMKRLARL